MSLTVVNAVREFLNMKELINKNGEWNPYNALEESWKVRVVVDMVGI